MSAQKWSYYVNKNEQGFISLEELLEGVKSERFDLSTLIKPPEGIHWNEIRVNPEILYHLPCLYVIDNVIYQASSGKEIISLYKEDRINVDTNVRLEKSGEWSWEKLKKSFYWEMVSSDNKPAVFYGHSSLLPRGRPIVARLIDKILSIFLVVVFFIMGLSFWAENYHFNVWITVLVSLIIGNIFVLLSGGVQAVCLCLFGGTLGAKITGFYILTSKLQKLSFLQALKREIVLVYTYLDKRSKDKAYYKRFGASEWDRKNGIIFSKEPPDFISALNLETYD